MTIDSFEGPKLFTDRKPRTLVLCFDGTANEYDADNTNVVKFFSLLKKDDPDQQLCYYQAGIGTFFETGVVSPLYEWLATILDHAIAWYIDQHVMNGYRFLMQNYRFGDKICLFGFSRGAYTARALAGMLYKVGLLPKDNHEQINFAMKLYKMRDKEGAELAKGFKQTFSYHVKVNFVGVWDTVASVGVIRTKTLPFTNSNKAITTFRHALSLDERRTKFHANYYHRSMFTEKDLHLQPEVFVQGSPVEMRSRRNTVEEASESTCNDESSVPPDDSEASSSRLTRVKKGSQVIEVKIPGKSTLKARGVVLDSDTDVKEVWFAGDHGDIGGGHVLDSEPHALSNIPLRWMVKEVMESNCGIVFEGKALEGINVNHGIPYYFPPVDKDPDQHASTSIVDGIVTKVEKSVKWSGNDDDVSVGPGRSARQKAENEVVAGRDKELIDAKSPAHDQLKRRWMWWLLELVPTHYVWQDEIGEWHTELKVHRGKGRIIRDKSPLFHYTVRERMKATGYVPRAKWERGTERYVD